VVNGSKLDVAQLPLGGQEINKRLLLIVCGKRHSEPYSFKIADNWASVNTRWSAESKNPNSFDLSVELLLGIFWPWGDGSDRKDGVPMSIYTMGTPSCGVLGHERVGP
jgi:hypothetical protein